MWSYLFPSRTQKSSTSAAEIAMLAIVNYARCQVIRSEAIPILFFRSPLTCRNAFWFPGIWIYKKANESAVGVADSSAGETHYWITYHYQAVLLLITKMTKSSEMFADFDLKSWVNHICYDQNLKKAHKQALIWHSDMPLQNHKLMNQGTYKGQKAFGFSQRNS